MEQRKFLLGSERAKGGVEVFEEMQRLAAGATGDEGNLATLDGFVVGEEQSVEENRSLDGRMGGGEEAGREGGVERMGVVEEREVEGAGWEEFWIRDRRHGIDPGLGGLRGDAADLGPGVVVHIHDFRGIENLAVEAGLDGADTFFDGRVRGPETTEHGAETLGEKEVADGGALLGGEGGTHGVAGDFFEGAADAVGVAGELDGGGVGQKFALAGDGGLDETTEKIADVADDQKAEAGGADGDENAAGVLAVARGGDAGAAERREDAAADETEDEDAEDERREAQVEAHVAVEDVAELVGDDALEFVACEFFEGAAGDGDDGIGGSESGGEGIDGGFVVEDVDAGHGDAGSEGHFLDDVEETALGEIGGVRIDASTADTLGDGGAAAGELVPFIKRGEADDGEGAEGDEGEELGLPEGGGGGELRAKSGELRTLGVSA